MGVATEQVWPVRQDVKKGSIERLRFAPSHFRAADMVEIRPPNRSNGRFECFRAGDLLAFIRPAKPAREFRRLEQAGLKSRQFPIGPWQQRDADPSQTPRDPVPAPGSLNPVLV